MARNGKGWAAKAKKTGGRWDTSPIKELYGSGPSSTSHYPNARPSLELEGRKECDGLGPKPKSPHHSRPNKELEGREAPNGPGLIPKSPLHAKPINMLEGRGDSNGPKLKE